MLILMIAALATIVAVKGIKKMASKNYYMDVVVIEKKRIRVDIDIDGPLTKERLLKLLKNQKYNDIVDEESLEYQEVISWDIEDVEEEGE